MIGVMDAVKWGAVRAALAGGALLLASSGCAGGSADEGGSCVSRADCAGGAACVDGRCVDDATPDAGACGGGQIECSGTCVNPEADIRHCGGCNQPCSTELECAAGVCVEPCEATESRCGVECVDTDTDVAHCGGCDAPCEAGLVCEGGSCLEPCTPTEPPAEVCDGVDNDCDREVDLPACEADLAVWFRFEEEEGPVVDASGNGFHGTATPTVVRGTDGKSGRGARFVGQASSRVRVPDADPLTFGTAFTIESWVRPEDCAHGGSGHNTVAVREAEFLFAFNNGCGLGNYVYNGETNPETGMPRGWRLDDSAPDTTLPAAAWTHLALTYDGATIRSYVNGIQAGAGTPWTGSMPNQAVDLFLGARPDCCNQTLNGTLDDLRIYRAVRTEAQICADAGGTYAAGDRTCTL